MIQNIMNIKDFYSNMSEIKGSILIDNINRIINDNYTFLIIDLIVIAITIVIIIYPFMLFSKTIF